MKRSNLIFVFIALVCVSSIASTASAAVMDPEDLWTSEDIVQLDAVVSEGVLTVQVYQLSHRYATYVQSSPAAYL